MTNEEIDDLFGRGPGDPDHYPAPWELEIIDGDILRVDQQGFDDDEAHGIREI